jgi:hypothetical protein
LIDRRTFLARSLAAAGLAAFGAFGRCTFAQTPGMALPVTLTVEPDAVGTAIPPDFLGFSYESSLIPTPGFFNAANTSLLALMGRLGKQGVLRIGGNSSEFSQFQAEPTPLVTPANLPPRAHPYAITPDDITRLGAFIRASGWKLIYGLNLGTGTPDQAAAEAAAVSRAMGGSLLAFQVGNEPDLFRHGLRPKTYSVGAYRKEWHTFAQAIRARVPNAPLAGPDTASPRWFPTVARQDAGDIMLLTQHYYAEGPGKSPKSTIAQMLSAHDRLGGELRSLRDAARTAKRPWRMAETNSCYGGGRYGVSDTLAASLWATDYLFQLADAGCAGANFHGGTRGAYTPLAQDDDTPAMTPRPLYYGLLLFAQAAQGHLVPAHLTNAPVGLTAYAARDGDSLNVTVINTDASQPVSLTIDSGGAYHSGHVLRLNGPALASTTGVTLGGAAVGSDGAWTPTLTEKPQFMDQKITLDVPAASAAVVRLRAPSH